MKVKSPTPKSNSLAHLSEHLPRLACAHKNQWAMNYTAQMRPISNSAYPPRRLPAKRTKMLEKLLGKKNNVVAQRRLLWNISKRKMLNYLPNGLCTMCIYGVSDWSRNEMSLVAQKGKKRTKITKLVWCINWSRERGGAAHPKDEFILPQQQNSHSDPSGILLIYFKNLLHIQNV